MVYDLVSHVIHCDSSGMAAAQFTHSPLKSFSKNNTVTAQHAFQFSFALTQCFIIFLVILIIADQRMWLFAVLGRLKRADTFVEKLANARPCDTHALIVKYVRTNDTHRHGHESSQIHSEVPSSLRFGKHNSENAQEDVTPALTLERKNFIDTATNLESDKDECKPFKILNKPMAMKTSETEALHSGRVHHALTVDVVNGVNNSKTSGRGSLVSPRANAVSLKSHKNLLQTNPPPVDDKMSLMEQGGTALSLSSGVTKRSPKQSMVVEEIE